MDIGKDQQRFLEGEKYSNPALPAFNIREKATEKCNGQFEQ